MIQKEHIRMQAGDGRGFLLTLTHNVETVGLKNFLKTKAHVLVSYEVYPIWTRELFIPSGNFNKL